MDKRIIESLKDILDFYSADTDRGKIEKNLEMLLNEAYLLGWKDSKDEKKIMVASLRPFIYNENRCP